MMVGTYRQHLACVAEQLNGVKRHRSMKPSSRDPQLGLASPLNYAANKSGKIKIKSPSKKEAGAGCKSPALASREGTGEIFFLDILFHRMSEIAMLQQQSDLPSFHTRLSLELCRVEAWGSEELR
ncbi:MAG: hypothetical protein WB755_21910 [Terriglobales bacterium]